jgi:ubiquinone/menaquinone biosynthesis C-methylase UbiE
MRNDYNLIADIYDIGVSILFGKEVYHSYIEHLDHVKASDKVLIVGGGSGRLLASVSQAAEIDYIELSGRMIKQAKEKRSTNIRFHQLDFSDFASDQKYDWVIFPYFLDLFTIAEIKGFLTKSNGLLKPKGQLIVSDFDLPRSSWHKGLIAFSIMILRLIVSLRITNLAPILDILEAEGYQSKDKKVWANGFIFSAIFRNRETFF